MDKKALYRILEIVGYEHDKDEFIKEFLALCHQRAAYMTLQSLPPEEQQKISQKEAHSFEHLVKITQSNMYQEQLSKAIYTLLDEYLERIIPYLSQKQMGLLDSYLLSLE